MTGTGSLGGAKETQAARCSGTCGGGVCVGKTRERATTCPVTKEFVPVLSQRNLFVTPTAPPNITGQGWCL